MTTRSEQDKQDSKAKRDRLEARISPEQKALMQHAANLQGRTLSDFIVSSVLRAAEEAVRSHQVTALTARDSQAFVEALLDESAPDERQRAAAERYKREFLLKERP